MGKEFEKAR